MPVALVPAQPSRFAVHRIDEAERNDAPIIDVPFSTGASLRGHSAINQPGLGWTFVLDEMQYAISGEMEVEAWLAPLYSESVKVHIRPGTVYTYPPGARKRVRVMGDQPLRHICFCTPSPDYPFPTAAALKGS